LIERGLEIAAGRDDDGRGARRGCGKEAKTGRRQTHGYPKPHVTTSGTLSVAEGEHPDPTIGFRPRDSARGNAPPSVFQRGSRRSAGESCLPLVTLLCVWAQ